MNDKTHETTPVDTKRQLRAPSLWQTLLILPILFLVGLNTLIKDRVFASFFTRRKHVTFTYAPRATQSAKAEAVQKIS